jgi:hypothetical protein
MTNRTLTLFRIGAWSWVITGAGHLIIETALLMAPVDPAKADLTAAMRAHLVELAGIRRSMLDLTTGLSLATGLAILFSGVLLLLVARVPQLVEQARAVTWLGLGASLSLFGLAAVLLPTPPIVLFAIASVCFGLALFSRRA